MTLKTISDTLGLSKTTVSLVLKGDGDRYRISKKTQQRIFEYAKKVGFEPDFFAKALVTKKTSTIGVVFPDVQESFMSGMIKGIESVLYEKGYSMMLSTSGFNSEFEMRNIRQLIRRKADGIILVPYVPIAVTEYSHAYLEFLKKSECPVIFADRVPQENAGLNWIVQDDYNRAFDSVGLLHGMGCRNIACLSFNLHVSSIQNRIRGYIDGMKGCGLKDAENLLLLNTQREESEDLISVLDKLSMADNPIDGLIITTGGIALKTKYLIDKSFKNLQKIKIVKFGKDPEYTDTGMIQILQPTEEMGTLAAKSLLDLINGEKEAPVQLKIKSRIKGAK